MAMEIGYEAHSACTEEILEAETQPLLIAVLMKVGIIDIKWDNW